MGTSRLQTGSVIDGFLIGDRIHKGGMSVLWAVSRPDIDLPLLMKIPMITEGDDPAAIVGFEMEQMLLPRLSGPHVPKFIAAGDFAVQPYIVIERLPGKSLYPRLDELPLSYEEVASIGARIAIALDDLHRQHVVHLDVKPSNVMFRATGEAVMIDYGLAHHEQLPDLLFEEFRLPYGTAPYMAPEQVLGARNDPRSDQFALGVLMYFFATGVRPFGDPQGLKKLKKRLWRDPVPPRQRRPDFPPWLQEIILRCLEVNPAWRYPSASQLAFDLQHPDQVRLTVRAERLKQDPLSKVIKRRFNSDTIKPIAKQSVEAQAISAPIIAVAVDLSEGAQTLGDALRLTVRRVLDTVPGARVACINVLKQGRLSLDSTHDAEGQNIHIKRIAQLRHWAEPLNIVEGKITYHVLEATDPSEAILDYARSNRVDHIVMGARANSTMRSLLGSVAAQVASQAPCTVTVVRPSRSAEQSVIADAVDAIEQAKSALKHGGAAGEADSPGAF
jgi:serine/threonine protein kinase